MVKKEKIDIFTPRPYFSVFSSLPHHANFQMKYVNSFLCHCSLSPPGASGIRVFRTSVRRPGSVLYFKDIIQVKIFVQGRISRSINGSKLIFHMSLYLYGTKKKTCIKYFSIGFLMEKYLTHGFFVPSYLPFWSYAPLKKSKQNLMHAISYEPCMLGFWNFIYGFLMEK